MRRICVCRLCKHTLSTWSGWELPRSAEWELCCNDCSPISKEVNRFLLFRRAGSHVNITINVLDQKFSYHQHFYFKSLAASILNPHTYPKIMTVSPIWYQTEMIPSTFYLHAKNQKNSMNNFKKGWVTSKNSNCHSYKPV